MDESWGQAPDFLSLEFPCEAPTWYPVCAYRTKLSSESSLWAWVRKGVHGCLPCIVKWGTKPTSQPTRARRGGFTDKLMKLQHQDPLMFTAPSKALCLCLYLSFWHVFLKKKKNPNFISFRSTKSVSSLGKKIACKHDSIFKMKISYLHSFFFFFFGCSTQWLDVGF